MNKPWLLASLSSLVVLSGCATQAQNKDVLALQQQLEDTQRELEQTRAAAQAQQSAASASSELRIPTPASSRVSSGSPSQSMLAPAGDLLPPGAKSGECYARVWVDPTYRTLTRKMLKREASEKVEVIPARYEMVKERVEIKPAARRIEQIPAVYETRSERVLAREAERVWRTRNEADAPPASADLLAAARRHGVDLDAATPGMCFHEHYRPAQYRTVSREMEVQPAREITSASEAQYRFVEKRVLVKEASTRLVDVPAVYETRTEQVVDVPAHTVWKKGTGPIQRIDEATGEIMCLVDVPATYKTVSRRVLVSKATTKTIEVPAEYKTIKVRELVSDASQSSRTIPAKYETVTSQEKTADAAFVWHEVHDRTEPASTRTGNRVCLTETPARYKTVQRQVLKTPASSRTITIPAEYKEVSVRKLVSPASEKRTVIPAEYQMVKTQELEKEGHMQWRSILCKTNATPDLIRSLQNTLAQKGYSPGPVDGVVGAQTIKAVNAYQTDNKLPVGPYLNIETLKHIGVI